MKKFLILFIVFSVSASSLYSQHKTVKGRVITDQLETMPGVLIRINDTVEVGTTNLDGFFHIEIPASVKKISFRYVGVDPTSIEVSEECDKTEVVMMLTGTDDFKTLKRAERKRKKRYKKLPEIHRKAFLNGIFETAKACFNREFEPYYLDGN
ncbi:MAG TPA: carboxypeptidase-like regulatory domain-containing protein [Salegentibacter sp.]|uniref:carboxypeptidase-like regulatory domain-containing protein n=1 Tax=Salegentibacter sp. TaxID=1903072 RepID=UPI002F92CF34